MCKAFSCIISKRGKVTWKFAVDSHEDLIKIAGYKDDTADKRLLKFARVEISPNNENYLTPDKWVLKIDETITPEWWSEDHEKKCWLAFQEWKKELDKILIYKPIVHPFRDIPIPDHCDPAILQLLVDWASAWGSVRASVWESVGASVRASVWESVGASVRASVWESVRASVWESARASVLGSVRASVWESVRASAWAYTGTFFLLPRSAWRYTDKIKCEGYPYQPSVDLWEMGIVPSVDGKIWRLHIGPNAQVLWQGTIEDAKAQIESGIIERVKA